MIWGAGYLVPLPGLGGDQGFLVFAAGGEIKMFFLG
jgi:hypothetical protein